MDRSLDWSFWEPHFEQFLARNDAESDAAHGVAHVHRVVATARRLAHLEKARLEIVLPAAWLHDCVAVPKDSPERERASTLAARSAGNFLRDSAYPDGPIPAIEHAIEAHSFSAAVAPRTKEAMVVRDADRLDAIGAVGTARALMLGGELGKELYDPDEPFPEVRAPDDATYVLDHFHVKLLGLAGSMTTTAGRAEAQDRTAFMHEYLRQLGREIGP